MISKKVAFIFFCMQSTFLFAQLPYAHEQAIYKDSSVFLSWAIGCSVNRGLQNIADSTSGYATAGDSTFAIGKADGSGVVSLGDGGSAILTFENPIKNGDGPDFAVFENGFPYGIDTLFFLELAFVEVSSDGQHFFRFPSASLTDTINQLGNGDGIDPKGLTNLAGKYIVNYGTPFDLDVLKNISGLDVNHITHVKIIDVVGSLNNDYARKDESGRKINDPWPTPFPSSGFDLDAVGVIHQQVLNGISSINKHNDQIEVYPNPINRSDELHISDVTHTGMFNVEIRDMMGKVLFMQPSMPYPLSIVLSNFERGIYLLKISEQDFITVKKIIIE